MAALEEALKDVKKVEGEGPLWLFGQARLLAVRSPKENNPSLLDEALQNLSQARDSRPPGRASRYSWEPFTTSRISRIRR